MLVNENTASSCQLESIQYYQIQLLNITHLHHITLLYHTIHITLLTSHYSLILRIYIRKKKCKFCLSLSRCSHSDYFYNVFYNFSGLASFNPLEDYGGVIQLSDVIKIIFICVPKMNESLTGLNNMMESNYWQHFYCGVNFGEFCTSKRHHPSASDKDLYLLWYKIVVSRLYIFFWDCIRIF